MKKRLIKTLSVALAICMLFTMGNLSVFSNAETATETHTHCVCGTGKWDKVGSHICNSSAVWEPWDGTISPTANTEHFFYLTKDITLPKQWTLATNEKLHICLNGFTINCTKRLSYAGNNADNGEILDVCDCKGGGKVSCTADFADHSHLVLYGATATNPTVNIYGVDVYGGTCTGTYGLIGLKGTGIFNMYGGSLNGGKSTKTTGTGGNVYIPAGAVFNMYDAIVTGGYAATGGNIYAAGTLNINGNSKIINSAKGENIYLSGTLNINGNCEITNAEGVGINAVSESNVNVGGKLTVSGNSNGNLCLYGNLNAIGDGIDKDSTVYFTSAVGKQFLKSDTDYSSVFISDVDNMAVIYDKDEKIHCFKTTSSHNKKIDIYLLAGQSNAEGISHITGGAAPPTDAERDKNKYENVLFYSNTTYVNGTQISSFTDYGPTQEGRGKYRDSIGPELGMAEVLDPLYQDENKDALILKHAIGGTNLLVHQDENGEYKKIDESGKEIAASTGEIEKFVQRGSWYPTALDKSAAFGENRPSGFLLREFKKSIITVYKDLISKGYKPENINFVGLSWMQGESDKKYPVTYAKVFTCFVDELREHISSVTGIDYSSLPIVIGEISETCATALEKDVTVNKKFISMQDYLQTIINDTITIRIKDYAVNRLNEKGESVECGYDNYHWKYTDMLKIGQAFANGNLAIINKDPSAYHTHCECGGKITDKKGGHICESSKKWAPIYCAEGIAFLKSFSPSDKYIYLENDITFADSYKILSNDSLHICLNGYTITGPNNKRTIYSIITAGSSMFTLCDCSSGETGKIVQQGELPATQQGGIILMMNDKSTEGTTVFNMYGGTITGGKSCSDGNSGGNIAICKKGTYFNMYGGTVSDGYSPLGYGGNIALSSQSAFNMYGGTVKNGYADKWGGNIGIASTSSAIVNICGGKITCDKDGSSLANFGTVDFKNAKVTISGNTNITDCVFTCTEASDITFKDLSVAAKIALTCTDSYSGVFASADKDYVTSGNIVPFKDTVVSYKEGKIYLEKFGDVNGDGKIDINDCVCISMHLAGKMNLLEIQLKAADVDGISGVTVDDAYYIAEYIVGIRTYL